MEKLEALKQHLTILKRVVIGFSGGVDSVFLTRVALDVLGSENVYAVLGMSESVSEFQSTQAMTLACEMGIALYALETHEMENPNYVSNPTNRCFYCKEELFNRLQSFAAQIGVQWVLDGTNFDDLSDFRPGRLAAQKAGVLSPLADAKLTKQEIREASKQLGLSNFNEPASPCLSSRIPYGNAVTSQALDQIEQAEAFLRTLGLREFRVRFFGTRARVELDREGLDRMRDAHFGSLICNELQHLGFQEVEIDQEPFQSGRLNQFTSKGETIWLKD